MIVEHLLRKLSQTCQWGVKPAPIDPYLCSFHTHISSIHRNCSENASQILSTTKLFICSTYCSEKKCWHNCAEWTLNTKKTCCLIQELTSYKEGVIHFSETNHPPKFTPYMLEKCVRMKKTITCYRINELNYVKFVAEQTDAQNSNTNSPVFMCVCR